MTNTANTTAPNRYDELSLVHQIMVDGLINATASARHAHGAVSKILSDATYRVNDVSRQEMKR